MSDYTPNILIFFADDLGFGDVSCLNPNGKIPTPSIDRLARDGMVFTDAHSTSAVCSPSRYSLLTGRYNWRSRLQSGIVRHYGDPLIDSDRLTVAGLLREHGYRTGCIGKWHLGMGWDFEVDESFLPGKEAFEGRDSRSEPLASEVERERWREAFSKPTTGGPTTRGFDYYFGVDVPNWPPYCFIENESTVGIPSEYLPSRLIGNNQASNPGPAMPYWHFEQLLPTWARKADEFIRDSARENAPFFLYVGYTAPHWPLHALPDDIAKYEGRYRKGGWDALRTARHEEMKGLGLVSDRWEISPRDDEAPPWEEVKARDWEDMRMAVYAAQIDRMDQGIGRIVAKLQELEIDDNTLVIFLADNGGCAEFLQEDGWCQRYATQTPDGKPIRTGNFKNVQPGGPDTFMSYDLPWANASNAPFRLYKHWVHEGGISTPLIVRWPQKIEASRIEHSVAHVVDLMATCLDAAGVPYPEEYNDHAIQPLEGESLVPAMTGDGWQRERPVFWEHEGNRAVRDGRWKLVSKYPGDWELYDMVADRTELNDLSGSNQPQADKMISDYKVWAAEKKVRPWPVKQQH